MKKKRAIRNYTLISIFIVLVLLLTVISFPVPGTSYTFKGLGNLHLGLELGGGVKNTYTLEVADWYDGDKEDAYREAVNRVQELLDKNYADAKVYLNGEDRMTIEVPDTAINNNYTVGLIEMTSAAKSANEDHTGHDHAEDESEDGSVIVTGKDIAKVEYMLNGTTHGVYIEFTEEGKTRFQELTKTVSEGEGTMYIYLDKNYDEPFSQTSVSEENTYGYTFISGSTITNKESGVEYADKLESAMIGVNMSTDLDEIEVVGTFGSIVRIAIIVITVVLVIVGIVLSYVLFKQLGLVSSLSCLFALMISVVISAMFDLQTTVFGWLGFLLGYVLTYSLHLYYLGCIKSEYAKGKKFVVSFTSGYKSALFKMLDLILVTTGTLLLLLIVPSSAIKMFTYNMLMTIPSCAFTSLYLNKVVTCNYTAFNFKDEKKVNFTREDMVDEI